jgi:predicted nucleic acid-binding Zn ribbon protein
MRGKISREQQHALQQQKKASKRPRKNAKKKKKKQKNMCVNAVRVSRGAVLPRATSSPAGVIFFNA